MEETWSSAMRRLVAREEAQERDKLQRRQLKLKKEASLVSGAVGVSTSAVGTPVPSEIVNGHEPVEAPEEAAPEEDGKQEEEDEEGDDDFMQKHLLSRPTGRWICLEDAQQANCVALNRRQTMFAVGERDGRVSIWDNVSLRVITRELDPTSIVVPDEKHVENGGQSGEEEDNSERRGGLSKTESHNDEDEDEDGGDANDYSTGNEDASAEDDDGHSVEEGDGSTEEDDEDADDGDHHGSDDETRSVTRSGNAPVTNGAENGGTVEPGLSVTDLRRVRSSLKVVTQVAWSCDSRWVFSGCEEKSTRKGILCVWDVEASTLVATFAFDAAINCLSVHPSDPNQVLVSSYNSVPVLLNVTTREATPLNEIPLENSTLTITIPNNSRHPALIVAARYGQSGEFIYAATTKATVAILNASTLARVNHIDLNILIQYVDICVNSSETALLITSSKGIHEFAIRRPSTQSETGARELSEVWQLSTGAVRAPWALCSFTGDEKFAIGVPVVRHRHIGENGLYTWDCATGKPQHNAGVTDGVNSLAWDTQRDAIIAVSATGALYVFEEEFTTTWPGSMYPAGFRLITDNELHDESFDVEDAAERDEERQAAHQSQQEDIEIFEGRGPVIDSDDSAAVVFPPLAPIENELLYLPAIPIAQHQRKHNQPFQGSVYHDERHFGLGQSVFEPLKVPQKPKSSRSRRKSGIVVEQVVTDPTGAAGLVPATLSGKRNTSAAGGNSSHKRRRR